jgi:DNA ligase-1
MITRPMLATKIKPEQYGDIEFPILMSPKLDGIRSLKVNGKCLSRKFKPIRNNFVRNWIEKNLPDGVDGELFVRGKKFNDITSGIMSEDGFPDFYIALFDYVVDDMTAPYQVRYNDLIYLIASLTPEQKKHVELVHHIQINNVIELQEYEQECIDKGYEGAMVRSMNGPYKNGRSTLREGYLIKIKRISDSEAVVIGFVEGEHNENEAGINELGLTKRSHEQDGKVLADTLGAFQVKDIKHGWDFSLGTGDGLTQELRKEIWDHKDKYMGKIVKYKYQPYGMLDKPRFPIWLGFRDESDMSEDGSEDSDAEEEKSPTKTMSLLDFK